MSVNNEIGTIQPIEEIIEICNHNKILFHTDAIQAFGKIDLNYKKYKPHMASFSAHKIYGPKGVGALYIKKGIKLNPLIYCLLYTSPSPRDLSTSRMPSSA